MKTLVAAAIAFALLGGSAAQAAVHIGIAVHPSRHHVGYRHHRHHRHQVCHWRHHHRVCYWR